MGDHKTKPFKSYFAYRHYCVLYFFILRQTIYLVFAILLLQEWSFKNILLLIDQFLWFKIGYISKSYLETFEIVFKTL